jgi:hypothetical protein
MAGSEGICSPFSLQPSARSPKLRLYETLFLWNQGVDQLVALLRGMEKLPFVRGTAGRERLFMVGWFAGILLWPLRMLRPQWAVVTKHIGAFGLAVALLAALALLVEPPVNADSGDPK